MIEHTMAVSDAELKSAIAALGERMPRPEKELLAEGWFRPSAIAQARGMERQPAENFCAMQVRNGRWERAIGLLIKGGRGKFYRAKKKEDEP